MVMIVLLMVSILAIVIGIFLSRSISKPVHELTKAAKKFKKGNLGHKIKVQSKDELGELAETFDEMRLGLKDRNDVY